LAAALHVGRDAVNGVICLQRRKVECFRWFSALE
jgi:hypothetical protein